MNELRRMDPHRNRRMYFFAHHRKALSDDLVRRVIRDCEPISRGDRLPPYTDEDRERWLRRAKEHKYFNALGGWDYPILVVEGKHVIKGRASADLILRQSAHVISLSRTVRIPAMIKDDRHWVSVTTAESKVDVISDYAREWFFDRIRPTIPIFEPDFAFADNDLAIMQNLDEKEVEPKDLVWPLMIYGPREVKAIGKQKLMDAPVWKVEELPYGGTWLQVAENPFTVATKDLKPLAKYLEREPRSLRQR